jgi:hypothetical protein
MSGVESSSFSPRAGRRLTRIVCTVSLPDLKWILFLGGANCCADEFGGNPETKRSVDA